MRSQRRASSRALGRGPHCSEDDLEALIAARIESRAEPGTMLISDATCQLLHDVIACEPKGAIEAKGVHYPIKVYQVGSDSMVPAYNPDHTKREV